MWHGSVISRLTNTKPMKFVYQGQSDKCDQVDPRIEASAIVLVKNESLSDSWPYNHVFGVVTDVEVIGSDPIVEYVLTVVPFPLTGENALVYPTVPPPADGCDRGTARLLRDVMGTDIEQPPRVGIFSQMVDDAVRDKVLRIMVNSAPALRAISDYL